MKKLILLFSLLAFGTLLVAQSSKTDNITKPKPGSWGFGFGVEGLGDVIVGGFNEDAFGNSQLLVRRYFTDRVVLRGALGINSESGDVRFENFFNTTFNGENARTDSLFRQTSSQLTFSISPGLEYHMVSSASKLDPYLGFAIPIGLMGATKTESDDELTITALDDGATLYARDLAGSTELDGGLSFGFTAIAGFNFFFSPNMAIGAEYNLGMIINNMGGNFRSREAGTIETNGELTTVDNDFTGRIEQSNTTVGLSTVGVNLSVFW
jgi:opacity protein-like surface antigen